MFGIGIPEIICILLIAVIVLGPDHMPRAAHAIGKWSAKLRSAAAGFERAIVQDEDLREIRTNLSEVRSEIEKAKSGLLSVQDEVRQIPEDIVKAYHDAKTDLETVQAMTGRHPPDSSSEDGVAVRTEASPDRSEPSPFMSRPLRWFDTDKPEHPSLRRVRLENPVLLPGPVARKVYRKPHPLDTHKNQDSFPSFALAPPKSEAAFCRTRRLTAPETGRPEDTRRTRLPRHE